MNTSRQIGGAVGLAALATIATSRTHDVARFVNGLAALTDGYTLAFKIESVLALAAGVAALFVPSKRALLEVMPDRSSAPEAASAVRAGRVGCGRARRRARLGVAIRVPDPPWAGRGEARRGYL